MGQDAGPTHKQIVQLPLPLPSDGESQDAVVKRGMEIGISLLHDPVVMINYDNEAMSHEPIEKNHPDAVDVPKLASLFNVPLHQSYHPESLTNEWRHFLVTEKIPIMGMTKKLSFHTTLRFNEDGFEALSDPGSSVLLYGKYVLSKSDVEPNCLQLTETTYLESSVLLSWYVKSTMIKAHERVNAYYKEKFIEKMRGKSWT